MAVCNIFTLRAVPVFSFHCGTSTAGKCVSLFKLSKKGMILRSTLCLDMQLKYNETGICEIFNVVTNRDFGHICFIVGLGTRETASINDPERTKATIHLNVKDG